MARELEKSDDYIKLLYINGLFQHTITPYRALASMASIKVDGKSVSTADHGATLPQSSIDAIDKLIAVSKSLPAPKTTFEVDALKIDIDGEVYSFDRRLGLYITTSLTNQGYSEAVIKQYFAKLSLWDVLVMDAALFSAEDPIQIHFIHQATHAEDFRTEKDKGDKFIKEQLHALAVNYYILPAIKQLDELELVEDEASKKQVVKNAESRIDIDRVANNIEFKLAANVFSACESQISAGRVPENKRITVELLVTETAKGISKSTSADGQAPFNLRTYNELIESLPLEHTWARIIGGAALCFAGLLLTAAAVAIAVHTFGIASPLSLVGIKIGVDMMIAGAAAVAAVASVSAVVSSGFFACSKGAGEMAEVAKVYATHREEKGEKARAQLMAEIDSKPVSYSLVPDLEVDQYFKPKI